MKIIIATFITIPLLILGSAAKADARCHPGRTFISSYLPCGTPVYSERYFIGYDRCGKPIWGTRVIRPAYRPVYRPVVRPVYVAPCPPRYVAPRRCDVPYDGVNLTFQGSWSR